MARRRIISADVLARRERFSEATGIYFNDGTPPAVVLTVTKEMAKVFLSLNIPGNRDVSESNLNKFRTILRAGEWVHTGQGIIFSGTWFLLDGQHRLRAIVDTGISAKMVVMLGIIEDAWSRLDRPDVRTGKDFVQRAKVCKETPLKNRASIVAALTILYKSVSGRNHYPPGITPMLLDAFPDIMSCSSHGQTGKLGRWMRPAIATYAALRMRMVDVEKAERFLSELHLGIGLCEDSPVYHLRKRLLGGSGKEKLLDKELLALIIKAWRSYLAGEPVRALRWRGRDVLYSDKTIRAKAEEFPEWPGPTPSLPTFEAVVSDADVEALEEEVAE